MSDSEQNAVLVVEDEVLIRLDLVDMLEQAGFATYQAGNSVEAIAILEKHPEIRAVFTDIQMPGDMDGLALSLYPRPVAADYPDRLLSQRACESDSERSDLYP